MSVLDNLVRGGRRLAGDVQASVQRARLEGEKRLLTRQHRAAAERLGEKVWELTRTGVIDPGPIESEVDEIDRLLGEIDAKVGEIGAAREQGAAVDGAPPKSPTGWEDADRFFRD